MYLGKAAMMAKKKQAEDQAKLGKEMMQQKTDRLRQIYNDFQSNLTQFAEKYKDQINHDSKFRDKFNNMCQDLGVDPMISKKNIFTDLGFGDYYQSLAMKILDICAKKRHLNGGIMRINNVIEDYNRASRDSIGKNDVYRALEKTLMLGNISILNNEYVCTIPLELNQGLNELMSIAEKYGFISAKLLKKVKGWEPTDF